MTSRLYFDVAVSRWHTDKSTGEEPRVLRIAWWRDDQPVPVCRIIRPSSNVTIDPSTVAYHGLTLEAVERDGVDPARVIDELEAAAHGVRTIVSFNADFHWRNLHRLMGHADAPVPTTAACAMKFATPILKIPPTRGSEYKSPSLVEACRFFKVSPPDQSLAPVARAISTVQAVRSVFEACAREHQPS